MFGLVSHVAAEVPPHDAVPGGVVLFVELLQENDAFKANAVCISEWTHFTLFWFFQWDWWLKYFHYRDFKLLIWSKKYSNLLKKIAEIMSTDGFNKSIYYQLNILEDDWKSFKLIHY